jgi:putative aldouronate transport system permease protein
MQITAKKHFFSFKKNRGTFALLLLGLPGIIFLFIFNYIPLYGLVLPFKNYMPMQGFFASPWSGLDNFKFLFQSGVIINITRNTVLMNTLFFSLNTVFSVSFALLLYEVGSKFVKAYQTAFFVPYFLSWVIVSFVGLGFLDQNNGLMNKIFLSLSLHPISFYTSAQYWPFLLSLFYVWKMTGYGAVIYYAGLTGIDSTYFEAASIDGASRLQQVWYISLPTILPLIIMINLIAIGRVFYGDIGLFYNVTMNSPLLYPTTDIIDTYVIRALRVSGDIGMSSAAGFYQSICGFILVLVSNWAAGKINSESALF